MGRIEGIGGAERKKILGDEKKWGNDDVSYCFIKSTVDLLSSIQHVEKLTAFSLACGSKPPKKSEVSSNTNANGRYFVGKLTMASRGKQKETIIM